MEVGLRVANEGFPDRNCNPDETLVSRKQSNALIESPEYAAFHAVDLAKKGIDFAGQRIQVDALCPHGDHPNAAQNARSVREALEQAGIGIAAL